MEVSRTLVHCPVHSETHSHQREGRELGEYSDTTICTRIQGILQQNKAYME